MGQNITLRLVCGRGSHLWLQVCALCINNIYFCYKQFGKYYYWNGTAFFETMCLVSGSHSSHCRNSVCYLRVPCHPVLWKPLQVCVHFVLWQLYHPYALSGANWFWVLHEFFKLLFFLANILSSHSVNVIFFSSFYRLVFLYLKESSTCITKPYCTSDLCVHSKLQQYKMSKYCEYIFGDLLLKKPLETHQVRNIFA